MKINFLKTKFLVCVINLFNNNIIIINILNYFLILIMKKHYKYFLILVMKNIINIIL